MRASAEDVQAAELAAVYDSRPPFRVYDGSMHRRRIGDQVADASASRTHHILIRPASIEDAEAVAGLTNELGYESSATTASDRLVRLYGSGSDAVFVAVTERGVAGWIHVALVSSLESDDYVEIRGLVVGSDFRNRRIGSRLVTRAEEWAQQAGIGRVRVRSNIKRTEARRFYERLGYSVTKTQNVFDKRLGS